MSTDDRRRRIAIVGAGLTGLSAARALGASGHATVLFEKSRGPGGRCATRRGEAGHFDHGAQYFTVRSAAFEKDVNAWCRLGQVVRYAPRLATIDANGALMTGSATQRFIAVPGMNTLAKLLAADLDVRCQTHITALTHDGLWSLQDEHGERYPGFDAMVLTAPPSQSAALLGPDDRFAAALQNMTMLPCWAAMLNFPRALPVAFDAAFVNHGPLSWIARDSAKPGRMPGERWLVHVGPRASRSWLEDAAEDVLPRIVGAFFAALGIAPTSPSHATAHRWRYALAAAPVDDGCWIDAERRLAIGGDWCAGSRIEGACMSGRAIAEGLQQVFCADAHFTAT